MQNVLSQREGQRVRRPERESPHAGGASDAESHPHRTWQRASGQANAQGPGVLGLKGDHDNRVGNAEFCLYLALVVNRWVRVGHYVDGYGLVAMVSERPNNDARQLA